MRRWMTGAALVWAVVDVSYVDAAFSGAGLRCREAVARAGTKLAREAVQALADCGRGRVSGQLAATSDCRSVASSDFRGKVEKAVEKLRSNVPKKCGVSLPADLSYSACPFPCDVQVAGIDDFGDVSACVACVVESAVEAMSGSVLGQPAVPLGDAEAECHESLADVATAYFPTILKEARKCQKRAEKNGATETSSCRDADPRSKIERTRMRSQLLVQTGCAEALLFDLDSCSQSTPGFLESCAFGAIERTATDVFVSPYALDERIATTTTTFGGTVTTTTNTMTSITTTTLPDVDFDYDCTIRFRVTSSATIGSLRYVANYANANGGFVGSGLSVQCTNLVAGASRSFFDDETARALRESIIAVNGFNAPLDLATCTFETDDVGLSASDFTVAVTEATTPTLQPLAATVSISSIQCSPKP